MNRRGFLAALSAAAACAPAACAPETKRLVWFANARGSSPDFHNPANQFRGPVQVIENGFNIEKEIFAIYRYSDGSVIVHGYAKDDTGQFIIENNRAATFARAASPNLQIIPIPRDTEA